MAKQAANPSIERELRTPRAAAIAGILFAALYSTSWILIRLSTPQEANMVGESLPQQPGGLSLAMSLVPFSGIAFLWFMGVVRDRMGQQEDQFFSTLFFGSGFLYLSMSFASAAVLGGTLALLAADSSLLQGGASYALGVAISSRLNSVYATRMAGALMVALGTIWVRTRVMPRWLALATYVVAAVLLTSIGFTVWVVLLFPAWVAAISAAVLVLNYREVSEGEEPDIPSGGQ
ncbi:MAG: hypothetical protein ACK2UX_21685 [Anaerolineae bacterium]